MNAKRVMKAVVLGAVPAALGLATVAPRAQGENTTWPQEQFGPTSASPALAWDNAIKPPPSPPDPVPGILILRGVEVVKGLRA